MWPEQLEELWCVLMMLSVFRLALRLFFEAARWDLLCFLAFTCFLAVSIEKFSVVSGWLLLRIARISGRISIFWSCWKLQHDKV